MSDGQPATTIQRDAVLFAWFVPSHLAEIGEYYLAQLRAHFADSRIFVGMNRGTDARWVEALLNSGLDLTIHRPLPHVHDYWDASGFMAALQGFDISPEKFNLAWFAHAKGGSQRDAEAYAGIRSFLERRFWQRRARLTQAFVDAQVGIVAARFAPWTIGSSEREMAALQRVYRGSHAPMGLHAKETFYVMRAEIVRQFLRDAVPEFLQLDLGDIGASRYFFELAFPGIAAMQGYIPWIDPDIEGANDPRSDQWLWHDPRQNHRLAAAELERWRADPFAFIPRRYEIAFR